jgi:hypothetical protein
MSETNDELSELDRDAMRQAIDLCLGGDPADAGRAEQVKDFLYGYRGHPPRPWLEVAEFCSTCRQRRRLRLRPWQSPPCDILTREEAEAILEQGFVPAANDPTIDISDCNSARLLLRMLDLNISPYNPDPVRALVAAKKAKRR